MICSSICIYVLIDFKVLVFLHRSDPTWLHNGFDVLLVAVILAEDSDVPLAVLIHIYFIIRDLGLREVLIPFICLLIMRVERIPFFSLV